MSVTKPSASDVKVIIDTDLTDSQIEGFIDAANLLVEEELGDSDLSASLLTEINKWLAAHLLSSRDQRVAKEAINDVSITYQGEYGLGLNSTSYGQQVLVLDSTGTLNNLGKKGNLTITSW